MNQIVTKAIVLSRTNYGEADRIVTLLTPDQGKVRLMARGVRKSKSKLAAGIELFSVSDITFIRGRSDIGTLISSRLQNHYGGIVKDLDRTMLAYDLIKQINRATEDEPEPEYFDLLQQAYINLEDIEVPDQVVQLWFNARLLKLSGHTPNLDTELNRQLLETEKSYDFNFDDMTFAANENGRFNSQHIKLMRLLFSDNSARAISRIQSAEGLLNEVAPLIQAMRNTYIRV